jgi:hypothetical protein
MKNVNFRVGDGPEVNVLARCIFPLVLIYAHNITFKTHPPPYLGKRADCKSALVKQNFAGMAPIGRPRDGLSQLTPERFNFSGSATLLLWKTIIPQFIVYSHQRCFLQKAQMQI